MLVTLAIAAISFVLAYVLLWLVFGYRPIFVFQRCLEGLANSDDSHRRRLPSIPRGLFAYVLALGVPFAGLLLHSLQGAVRRSRRPRTVEDRRTALLIAGTALPWIGAVLAGKPRGETEHVFLLFVPATALAAAAAARRFYDRQPRWVSDVAVPLMALQAIALDVLFETFW